MKRRNFIVSAFSFAAAAIATKIAGDRVEQAKEDMPDDTTKNGISFSTKDYQSIMVIADNGNFYVKGKKVTNDIEVYNALKEFLVQN